MALRRGDIGGDHPGELPAGALRRRDDLGGNPAHNGGRFGARRSHLAAGRRPAGLGPVAEPGGRCRGKAAKEVIHPVVRATVARRGVPGGDREGAAVEETTWESWRAVGDESKNFWLITVSLPVRV